MTEAQFLEALKKVKGRWCVGKEFALIRITLDGHRYCPITAVAWAQTKERFSVLDWPAACDRLKLAVKTGHRIIMAADRNVAHSHKLRRQLLEAARLSK